jgi:para-nitrobenzyl esterase
MHRRTLLSGKGTEVVADDPSKYTLEFIDDDQVLVRVDCNRGKGTATIDGTSIDLQVALTRAACPPGSLSTEYTGDLNDAVSWVIRDGQLHLALPVDAGIATFRPVVPSAPDAATPAG